MQATENCPTILMRIDLKWCQAGFRLAVPTQWQSNSAVRQVSNTGCVRDLVISIDLLLYLDSDLCVHVHIRVCVRACVCACVRACVCVCACDIRLFIQLDITCISINGCTP